MKLTPREEQIAAMVAKGYAAKKIAAHLGLSTHTVNVHIRQAASRIDGDSPPRHRLTLWFYHLYAEDDAGAA